MQTILCKTKISQLGEGKMAFTISTASVDRDQDTIDPAGWDVSSYLRNPIVLWQHDSSQLPVARATKMWSDSRGLNSEIEFPPRGVYPFADPVHDLVKAGFLNACSVGFIPITQVPDGRGPGKKIMSAELLEFSLVTVPSNRDALVLQRSANSQALQKWFGDDGVEIDLEAINRSMGEIDLTSLEWSDPEIAVDPALLAQAFELAGPEIVATLRAEMRVRARIAATEAVNHLTGRLP